MTTVRELISGAMFTKTKRFDNLTPEISIFLPTFNRGDNGLLKLCIDSILNQSFQNFELIVVDDASVDSTSVILQKYMENDSRIAVIRHKQNIGLPAVSEFEAYTKARGENIFFAFDDNEYEPNALEVLYNFFQDHLEVKIAYGIAAAGRNQDILIGENSYNYSFLHRWNYIPNSPLMLKKSVIEEIGFFDPHVIMTRLCDWDLWMRIADRYYIYNLNVILSKEKGSYQRDSVGNSYPVFHNAVYEWVHYKRNDMLVPQRFLDYEVDCIPSFISENTQKNIRTILKEKFSDYFWRFEKKLPTITNGSPYIVILCLTIDACVSLCFSFLEKYIENRLIILNFDTVLTLKLYHLLFNANAVIFIRMGIESFGNIYKLLIFFKVPYYYYTDDNLFILKSVDLKTNISYLKNSAGILVTSQNLKNYFISNKIHNNVKILNPVLSKDLESNVLVQKSIVKKFYKTKELNILCASNRNEKSYLELANLFKTLAGNFKLKIFLDNRKLSYKRLLSIFSMYNIEFEFFYFDFNYECYIRYIQEKNINFIIHPELDNADMLNVCIRSIKSNEKNKTLNMFLTAYLTSSFLLVPDTAQYNVIKNKKYLSDLVYDSIDDCLKQINKIIFNKSYLESLQMATKEFAVEYFNADNNQKILKNILNNSQKQCRLIKKFLLKFLTLLFKMKILELRSFVNKNPPHLNIRYYVRIHFIIPMLSVEKNNGLIIIYLLGIRLLKRKLPINFLINIQIMNKSYFSLSKKEHWECSLFGHRII